MTTPTATQLINDHMNRMDEGLRTAGRQLRDILQQPERSDFVCTSDFADDEPETITAEAEQAVYGDRNDGYGHPRQNMTRIAAMWTALLHDKLEDGAYVSPEDVARCMVAMKLSRDVNQPRRDNRVDMAGYALALDRLETGR